MIKPGNEGETKRISSYLVAVVKVGQGFGLGDDHGRLQAQMELTAEPGGTGWSLRWSKLKIQMGQVEVPGGLGDDHGRLQAQMELFEPAPRLPRP